VQQLSVEPSGDYCCPHHTVWQRSGTIASKTDCTSVFELLMNTQDLARRSLLLLRFRQALLRRRLEASVFPGLASGGQLGF